MIWFLLMLLFGGLIVGGIARLLVPGPDPIGLLPTALLGIAGSFVGGFLGWVLFGTDFEEGAFQTSGLLGSIIGAAVLLLVVRRVRGPHRSGYA